MSRLGAVQGDITHNMGYGNHDFLAGLTEAQRSEIMALGEVVQIPEGEVVLGSGERSTYCYLVTKGSVTIALSTPRVAVSLQVVGPGEVFGWSALLKAQDSRFEVRAREATTAVRISGVTLAERCRRNPDLGVELLLRFLAVVGERVSATEAVFAEWCGIRRS
ncbi:MAG TPA: cyclic nucleotide-binding domain-containing protein [Verrucomicrobiae bacterium]|nr:cyclic nucleotide-binding domain-containing protein [Verrucomicrobiae bacterium]